VVWFLTLVMLLNGEQFEFTGPKFESQAKCEAEIAKFKDLAMRGPQWGLICIVEHRA
jgi:hypothetical protein